LNSKISEDLIEEVRRGNDIVEVISEYSNLKRTGRNYQGLCPFHAEKTPSFSVNVDKQLFHCFGCKAGGNIFNFIMKIENLEFYEALEFLAKRAGIVLPDQEQAAVKSEKDYLYEANSLANRYFHYLLCKTKIGEQARAYLMKRGIHQETIEKFRLGYAANNWDGILKALGKRGIKEKILEKAGLVVAKAQGAGYYDRFRQRLIFPILDVRGRIIGFGGRVLDNTLPKYLNSPETILFNKSKNLFGLYYAQGKIREKKQVLIVEGYLDFLALYQEGIENVVASLGTALTREQAKLLTRYTEEVVVAYDGDAAGEIATLRGLEILQAQGLKVKVLPLPENHDPDSFLREQGKEKFLALIEEALPWVEYSLLRILAAYKGVTTENKAEMVEKSLPILLKIRNQVERDEYIRFLAERLAVREDSLRSELARFSRALERGKLRNKEEKIRNNNNDYRINLPSLATEKTLLSLILKNKEIALWSQDVLSSEDFFNENHKRIFSLVGELINMMDTAWAEWVDKIEDQRLREIILSLLMEELPEAEGVEPEKIALDCLHVLKKYGLDEKITQLQVEIKQAEERGEYTRVRTLLDECQELIRRRKEISKD